MPGPWPTPCRANMFASCKKHLSRYSCASLVPRGMRWACICAGMNNVLVVVCGCGCGGGFDATLTHGESVLPSVRLHLTLGEPCPCGHDPHGPAPVYRAPNTTRAQSTPAQTAGGQAPVHQASHGSRDQQQRRRRQASIPIPAAIPRKSSHPEVRTTNSAETQQLELPHEEHAFQWTEPLSVPQRGKSTHEFSTYQ